MKSGEYFEKDDIFAVKFKWNIIHVKEYMTSQPSFILQIQIHV